MIPIRDTTPSRNYPAVNMSLIGINIVVYLIQSAQLDGNLFIYVYGLVPARYTHPEIAAYFTPFKQAFSFLSYMFLHGGFFHLLGNMWTLYVFGDNIEDRLGPVRYLMFYLLCGVTSGVVHLMIHSDANVPIVGASGAISGVMGAYFILYPKSRVLAVIPIIIIPYFVELPAFIFLGVWFLFQFISAASPGESAIAWWAHIGGFVAGIAYLKLFRIMPETGITQRLQPAMTRKRTHRLQVIHPHGVGDDPNLYGTIEVTQHEAMTGTLKLVNIPWMGHQRLYRVTVPPGTSDGSFLRLRGMGKIIPNGQRGDLLLKVRVIPW